MLTDQELDERADAILKRVVGNSRVIGSTVSKFDGSGSRQVVYPRFNQRAGVEWFRSWVYIAAMIVANECARVPLRMYVRNKKGRQKNFASAPVPRNRKAYLMRGASPATCRKAAALGDDFVELTEPHPAIETLNYASDYANGYDLMVLRYLFLKLTGNAYLHPVFDRALGIPTEAWLLPAQWVEVKPSETDLIGGYVYGSDELKKTTFKPDEVIHFKLPNPDSPYYGKGCVEAVWSALELHRAKRETDIANFQNRGRPDWLAVLRNANNQDQIDRFSADMERKVMGNRKSGRFAAIGGDVDIKQLNFPPDDIGDPDRVLDEIAGAFGVPRPMLTGGMSVAGGGTEQADRTFMRGTVAPMLCMDEQQLNAKWLPLFGVEDDAMLAYDNPVPEDERLAMEKGKTFVSVGVMTPNEVRTQEGLPESDDEMANSLLFNGRPRGAAPDPFGGLGGGGGTIERVPQRPQSPEVDLEEAVKRINREIRRALRKSLKGLGHDHQTRLALPAPINGPACSCGGCKGKAAGDTQAQADGVREEIPAVAPQVSACANEVIPALINAGVETDAAVAAAQQICEVSNGPTGQSERNADRPTDQAGVQSPAMADSSDHDGLQRGGGTSNGGTITALGRFLDSAFSASDGSEVLGKADASDTIRDGEPEAIGRRLMRTVARILADAESKVTNIIAPTKRAKRADAEALAEIEKIVNDMGLTIGEEIRPLIERIIAEGGQQALSRIADTLAGAGIEVPAFTVGNPAVPAAARKFTERLAGEVSANTIEWMRDAIARGIEAGETPAELSARVRDTGAFSPQRAEVIARSESARAYGDGAIEGWKESGVVQGKVFQLAAGACPICEAFAQSVAGQVFDLDAPFLPLGGTVTGTDGTVYTNSYADAQAGNLHPNDRCWMEPVLIGTEKGGFLLHPSLKEHIPGLMQHLARKEAK